mmetsp:Transcript_14439/g.20478  ORF Transcript_14439/g.20478 Transcript_14439/m.20478 type:complete len:317 (+) Transcript_14439:306-1256(+)
MCRLLVRRLTCCCSSLISFSSVSASFFWLSTLFKTFFISSFSQFLYRSASSRAFCICSFSFSDLSRFFMLSWTSWIFLFTSFFMRITSLSAASLSSISSFSLIIRISMFFSKSELRFSSLSSVCLYLLTVSAKSRICTSFCMFSASSSFRRVSSLASSFFLFSLTSWMDNISVCRRSARLISRWASFLSLLPFSLRLAISLSRSLTPFSRSWHFSLSSWMVFFWLAMLVVWMRISRVRSSLILSRSLTAFSCPIDRPAPLSTSLLRFWISVFNLWIVSRARFSFSCAPSTIFQALSISFLRRLIEFWSCNDRRRAV